MEHWTQTVLNINVASSAYFLLLDIWQRLLLHSRATFGLKEEAVETLSLSRAWRCSSVSLDLYLDLLKFKEGREELFAQVCAPKKINGPLKHSGKLREAGGGGGNSFKNCQELVGFSSHLHELGFEFRVTLQVNELHLKHRRGNLHIKNLKCASVRLEACNSALKFLL